MIVLFITWICNLPIVIIWIIYIASWSVIKGGMQSVSKETKDLVLEVFEIRGEHNSVSRFVARAETFTRTCMDGWDQTPSVHLHLPFSVHFMVLLP